MASLKMASTWARSTDIQISFERSPECTAHSVVDVRFGPIFHLCVKRSLAVSRGFRNLPAVRFVGHGVMEPGPCERPVSVRGRAGDAYGRGRLIERQASKK